MGMNPDSGELRELQSGEDLKKGEVLFKVGELVVLKGCIFQVKNVNPNPENMLILKGVAKNQEANQF